MSATAEELREEVRRRYAESARAVSEARTAASGSSPRCSASYSASPNPAASMSEPAQHEPEPQPHPSVCSVTARADSA